MSLFSVACKAFQDGCSLSPTSRSSPSHLSATTPTLETHTCQALRPRFLQMSPFPIMSPTLLAVEIPFVLHIWISPGRSVPSPNPVRLSRCLPHHSGGDGVLSLSVYLSIFSIKLWAHEGKAHIRLTHSCYP